MATLLTDFWVNTAIVGFIATIGIILADTIIRQEKSVTNSTVATFFISIVFWILFAHLGDSKPLQAYSLLFNRIVYASLFFWFYSLALLPFVFPKDSNIVKKPIRIVLLSIVSILAILTIFTDKFLARVELHSWGAENIDGPWVGIMYAFTVLGILPLIRFFWVYKKSNKEQKNQLKYFFLGLGIFIAFVLLIYMGVQNITGTDQYYRYGNYSAVFLIGFTAYAIIKHHLFDIRVILTEVAVILINIVSAVQVFTANSITEAVFRFIFLAVILAGSLLLVRSVKREIEQRKKIQKLAADLEAANAQLKKMDELKDDFISMASHELNTPVSAIKGYLSMILEEGIGGKIPAQVRDYLEKVYSASQRLGTMIKDLLNVSRIESGRIHLIYEQKPIENLIEQAIGEIMSKAKEVHHSLTFKKPASPMPLTWFDVTRIMEVLINLIGNAIKYTDPGGKIETSVSANDKFITISVKDNGRGIPKDKQDQLFSKFAQVDILKDEIKGTGLGMYISKKFIELHSGKIWFKSEGEGKGTTFYFTLPILKDKPHDPHEGEGAVLH